MKVSFNMLSFIEKPCTVSNYSYPLVAEGELCQPGGEIYCGQICTFRCDDPYTLAGSGVVKCCNNGVLTPAIPACKGTLFFFFFRKKDVGSLFSVHKSWHTCSSDTLL